MQLENQVVSLELAKQLKELGFKQESLFWWVDCVGEPTHLVEASNCSDNGGLSAYTVAELGEMLGENTQFEEFSGDIWNITLSVAEDYQTFIGDTETDARAKMLIYLKENKLI